jgi:hypothetical protein
MVFDGMKISSLHITRMLVSAIPVVLAMPFAAASPPPCTAGFARREKDGAMHFVHDQTDPNNFGPTSIDSPMSAVRCSPAGRIVVVTEGEDAPGDVPTYGGIGITVIDPASHRVLFDDLVSNYDFSPDNRLLVFGPWGGHNGAGDVLSGQTMSLVDMDAKVSSSQFLHDFTVDIYPTEAISFHTKYKATSQDQKKYWDDFFAWFEKFELMPHPVTRAAWQGPRQFSLLMTKDQDELGRPIDHQPLQTVTAAVDLPVSRPPVVNVTISNGPACPNGLPNSDSFTAAIKACAGGK